MTPILDSIEDILLTSKGKITEFELLKALIARNESGFSSEVFSDEFTLFQSHFLLFHILYVLRDRLLKEKASDLRIECLHIEILPLAREVNPNDVSRNDKLREYYLDLKNLESTTPGDVRDMLKSFWKKFTSFEKRESALKTMGLNPDASESEIKSKYRELAREHHPDKGGDAEKLIEINAAMEILKSSVTF